MSDPDASQRTSPTYQRITIDGIDGIALVRYVTEDCSNDKSENEWQVELPDDVDITDSSPRAKLSNTFKGHSEQVLQEDTDRDSKGQLSRYEREAASAVRELYKVMSH